MADHHPTAMAVQAALANAASNGSWRMYDGPNLASLRTVLSAAHGRSHVRLCCSGTFGVELAIRSLHLNAADEVLLAGYDFPGNLRAIQDAGATACLYDVDCNSWVPKVEHLEQAIGTTTKAVVISHLHGAIAPMAELCAWARDKGLFVIEDACQAHGATVDGKPAGAWGDLSVLSYGGSKLIAAGRGGAVLTNDARFAQRMTVFCERGNDSFALSELQAAAILPQYALLSIDHRLRADAAKKLLNQLARFPWIEATPFPLVEQRAFYKVGLMIAASHVQSARAHLFVNSHEDVHRNSLNDAVRAGILRRLVELGIEVGAGFRGFADRSSSRCRKPVPLTNSRMAAAATIVLHHSHLLSPDTGLSSVDRVIAAFETVNQELGF